MNIPLMIAVYFIIWWLVLFVVLPIGVRTQGEAGEVVPGTPESAPVSFRLLKVVIITTVVAFGVFLALLAAVEWGVIDIGSFKSYGDPAAR